jgi:hypothetical protein
LKEYGRATPGKDKDDQYTRNAAAFRSLKDNCKNEIEQYRLYEKYPDVAMAYELWDEDGVSLNGRANPMRYEIEARLLAREPIPHIAKKTGATEKVLEWYEKLFFNVLDRIDNISYITNIAIGDMIQRGMSDRDYAILWKLYGYFRGPHMIDFLMTTFTDRHHVDHDSIERALNEDHRTNMRRKAALASRMMGVNGHTQDRLIELQTKIIEIEKSADSEGMGSETVNQNIHVMLSHLPLLVGQQLESLPNQPITPYRKLTADLRASEMLALTAGIPVDQASLSEYKFPEPPNDKKTE